LPGQSKTDEVFYFLYTRYDNITRARLTHFYTNNMINLVVLIFKPTSLTLTRLGE
ncbi:MAG: hypothetical protein UV57_C0036G0001, partial [Parcubacteria group bacterium GW2011_GWD2_43_10]